MCLNHSGSREAHFRTLASDETSVFFCLQPARQRFFSQAPLLHTELRQKDKKKEKNVTIKGSWCLDCKPRLLTAKQRRATTAKYTFHISLVLVLPVSLALPSPASPRISQRVSFITLLSSHAICFSGLVSVSQFLPVHTKIILYPSTPSDSCYSSGRAIRPISPISRCWVGMMRNGLAAMRVACATVRYACVCVCVWAGMTEMRGGCEVCVVQRKERANRK